MRSFFGGGGGGAVPTPPSTPPITPPMEPPATPPGTPPCMPPISGVSSSLMILMSFGITLGAVNLPASSKCAVGLTLTTCTTAGGGGGGGGGGGAINMVAINVLGSASVNSSGIRIRTATNKSWNSMDTTTVHGLFVFVGLGLDTTKSSNMVSCLLPRIYRVYNGAIVILGLYCRLRVR